MQESDFIDSLTTSILIFEVRVTAGAPCRDKDTNGSNCYEFGLDLYFRSVRVQKKFTVTLHHFKVKWWDIECDSEFFAPSSTCNVICFFWAIKHHGYWPYRSRHIDECMFVQQLRWYDDTPWQRKNRKHCKHSKSIINMFWLLKWSWGFITT